MSSNATGRHILAALFCLFLATSPLTVGVFAQKPQKAVYVPNEVLVKFRPGKSDSTKRSDLAQFNSSIAEDLGDQGWVRVVLGNGETVEQAVKSLGLADDVESVQPNYYYHLQTVPNDTLWGDQYLWGMPKISAPAAWDLST